MLVKLLDDTMSTEGAQTKLALLACIPVITQRFDNLNRPDNNGIVKSIRIVIFSWLLKLFFMVVPQQTECQKNVLFGE